MVSDQSCVYGKKTQTTRIKWGPLKEGKISLNTELSGFQLKRAERLQLTTRPAKARKREGEKVRSLIFFFFAVQVLRFFRYLLLLIYFALF